MTESIATVFVVDDDASVRQALKSLIRSVGLRVEVFGSADEFLKSKLPDGPSCLVLDVRLPGQSGLDFQKELTKAGIHTPVIFITGHGDIPMSVRATEPISPDNSAPLKGLFYGGGFQLLTAQAIGSLIITTATFVVAISLMYLVNATGTLRVSKEGELYGLDLHEHGIPAYPEYVISSIGTTVGLAERVAGESKGLAMSPVNMNAMERLKP